MMMMMMNYNLHTYINICFFSHVFYAAFTSIDKVSSAFGSYSPFFRMITLHSFHQIFFLLVIFLFV